MTGDSPSPRSPVAGIDLGGTNMQIGIVDAEGKVRGERRQKTADNTLASRDSALASRAATRNSLNRFRLLLLAAPSVPRATLTPLASNLVTGQVPEASFILAAGQ